MNPIFVVALLGFIVVSTAMILIILVQRPTGGGLAGAFGGAGATSSESVFGGRVGDVLTNVTIGAFVVYLGLAITLTLVSAGEEEATPTDPILTNATPGTPVTPANPAGSGTGADGLTAEEIEGLQSTIDAMRESGIDVPSDVDAQLSPADGTFDPGTLDFDDPTDTDGGSNR